MRLIGFRYNANIPIGISLARGTLNPVPAYLISVILKANPNLPLGYYILTAYPEP